MKNLFLLATLPAAVLAFTVACDDGTNVTPCESDVDCDAVADVTPTCDTELGQCVADNSECAVKADCQIGFNNSGGTLEVNPACTATTDCADGETCALGFNDEGSCVLNGACPDGTAGAVTLNVTLADGGTADVCVDENSTCTDGTCEP